MVGRPAIDNDNNANLSPAWISLAWAELGNYLYTKAPLRGLLKEIPENHLIQLGLETPACVLHITQLSRPKQQN